MRAAPERDPDDGAFGRPLRIAPCCSLDTTCACGVGLKGTVAGLADTRPGVTFVSNRFASAATDLGTSVDWR